VRSESAVVLGSSCLASVLKVRVTRDIELLAAAARMDKQHFARYPQGVGLRYLSLQDIVGSIPRFLRKENEKGIR
jgi:hypothetical protein